MDRVVTEAALPLAVYGVEGGLPAKLPVIDGFIYPHGELPQSPSGIRPCLASVRPRRDARSACRECACSLGPLGGSALGCCCPAGSRGGCGTPSRRQRRRWRNTTRSSHGEQRARFGFPPGLVCDWPGVGRDSGEEPHTRGDGAPKPVAGGMCGCAAGASPAARVSAGAVVSCGLGWSYAVCLTVWDVVWWRSGVAPCRAAEELCRRD